MCGLLIAVASLLQSTGSRGSGLSSCGTRVKLLCSLERSSKTRDWTRVPCIGRRILNHWTTREVPRSVLDKSVPGKKKQKNFLKRIQQMVWLYYLFQIFAFPRYYVYPLESPFPASCLEGGQTCCPLRSGFTVWLSFSCEMYTVVWTDVLRAQAWALCFFCHKIRIMAPPSLYHRRVQGESWCAANTYMSKK